MTMAVLCLQADLCVRVKKYSAPFCSMRVEECWKRLPLQVDWNEVVVVIVKVALCPISRGFQAHY